MVGIRSAKSSTVFLLALLALVALAVAACGGSSNDANAAEPSADAPAAIPAAVADVAAPVDEPEPAAPAPAPEPEPAAPAPAVDAEEEAMGTPSLPTSVSVVARDNVFDLQTITASANSDFRVTLMNDGVLPHNIAFLTKEGGVPLNADSNSAIILEEETTAISFVTPDAGTYFFYCVVHPLEMTGTFIVQ